MLGLQAKKLIKYRAESSRYSSLDLDFKKTCDSTFSGSMLWLTALSESLSFCRTFSLKCNDLHKHSTASSIRGNGKKRKVFKDFKYIRCPNKFWTEIKLENSTRKAKKIVKVLIYVDFKISTKKASHLKLEGTPCL